MWPLWPLSFRPEVKCPLQPSSAHLCSALAVILTAVAAESPLPAPRAVAKAFVMVLVRFGVFGAAVWRLSAMVGVVDGSLVLCFVCEG